MSSLVPIVMFGWIPVGLALFLLLPARRAVLAGFLAGWMLLPATEYRIQGLPDYTRVSAVCGVVLLGIAIFDFPRLLRFRVSWWDAPVMMFCCSPFVSSWTNHLGGHEGFSVVFAQGIAWGAPYLVGRLYFADLKGLRELAGGMFVAGAVYAPSVIFESWRGPVLSQLVYGFEPSTKDLTRHFGGARPMVFLDGALMLAAWMAFAAVAGIWLWRSSVMRVSWLLAAALVGAVSMRSLNAWILLVVGAAILFLAAAIRSKAPLVCAGVLIVVFLGVRATGAWSGKPAVAIVATVVNAERAQSLNFRLENEQVLAHNARVHPLFGWGRQAAGFYNERGEWTIPDSLWIITFVQYGAVGLVALFTLLLLPVVRFLGKYSAIEWSGAVVGPAAALAVILILYTVDNLFNASTSPILMLAAGGLMGDSLGAAKV